MIAEIAHNNGYVVNPFARGLRLKRTQTIGVVIPLGHAEGQLISDPFFLEMLGRLADEITLRGYEILLSKVAAPKPGWLDNLIHAQRTDGMVIIGQSDQHQALNAASAHYVPMVVWGAHLADQTYCAVGLDNVAGGYMATRHLIDRGRRKIAFLGDPNLPEIGQRREGYLRACREAGLELDPRLDAKSHFTLETATEAAEKLLTSGVEVDGVFAASDVIALAAINVLRKQGKSVPGDVAVVGFDDSAIAAHTTPAITTVRQDLGKAAKLMIELLFQRLEGEVAPGVLLTPELVIRGSTGE
jgi:DNA-binding LacI/PurR family transcriptional regulator